MSKLFNSSANPHFRVDSAPISGYPATLAIWMRKSSNALRGAFCINDTAGTSRFYLGLSSGGGAIASVTSSSNSTSGATGATVTPNDQWYHVAGVYVAEASRIVYLNGVSDGTSTTTRPVSGFNRLTFGCLFTGTSESSRWIGELADAVVYNRALSAAEVAQLYRWGPMSLPRTGLVFWSRMTESGDLRDLVGGRVLTAYNSPEVSPLHPRIR